MLELHGIRKDYPAGDSVVHALKGIDLSFRNSEFVSILGPSGCGKTTLLNIIGGLDRYTEGDLVINGVSTKKYKNKDWDTYRNHSVGFVFQSYNLIPHQNVLRNVELALTLSGVGKKERRERAKKALEQVGLGNQLKKRPSEMSGGQMQRVAIARALVNNPDIILADEPTGALDTETSVQVMEILKEISKDKLIVMVTHNPDLAEKYSTRIIRMLDGELQGDSDPIGEDEMTGLREAAQEADLRNRKKKKPSMSFFTAFGLSLNNLFTKKGRTLLTAFAGSIGIIGIALIIAVSQGTTNYINMIQENTLSSYPLSIQRESVDLSSLMSAFMGGSDSEEGYEHDTDAVYPRQAIYKMVNAFSNLETNTNDLKSFKEYIEKERATEGSESGLDTAISAVSYGYDLDLKVYTESVDGEILHADTQELLRKILREFMGMNTSSESSGSMSSMSSMMSMSGSSSTDLWQEMLNGDNGRVINPLLEEQYDLVYGSWPNSYDEVVLVLNENNELDDMTLYALGLESSEDITKILEAASRKEELDFNQKSWTYEEVCAMTYRVILDSDCYVYDETTGTYTDLRDTEAGLRYLYDRALELKVTGIIRPNPDATVTMLSGSIGYTTLLTDYVMQETKKSAAVAAQMEDPTTDIFTGMMFAEASDTLSDEEKETQLRETIDAMDLVEQATLYVSIMSTAPEEILQEMVDATMSGMDRETMNQQAIAALSQSMSVDMEVLSEYVLSMSDEELASLMESSIREQAAAQYAQQVQMSMMGMSPEEMQTGLQMLLDSADAETINGYYETYMELSDSTYEKNLETLGVVDEEEPSIIRLYASTFANKDVIADAISEYNKNNDDLHQIHYTDYVGLIMSSMTTIINAITYVLIAFVAISLVVSSIMIGVITLISVQERTKEIGILRAMGASKRDVSSMFNAETIIIGFVSGILGVGVTVLLCIPINAVIHALTGIASINAVLPQKAGITLVIISVVLTLFAGIIPSRSAAKKDPVVALRTE